MQALLELDVAKKKADPPRSESRKMDKQVRVSSEAWELAESVARVQGISAAEYMSRAIVKTAEHDIAAMHKNPSLFLPKPKGK